MNRFGLVIRILAASIVLANAVEAQVGRRQSVVDPNVATEQELRAVPHLNATLVKGILDRRPFVSMTVLHAFLSPQLSKEQLSQAYGRMFIATNLNTASKE